MTTKPPADQTPPAEPVKEDVYPEPGKNPDGTDFKLPTGKDYVAGQPVDESELEKTTADEKKRIEEGHAAGAHIPAPAPAPPTQAPPPHPNQHTTHKK